MSDERLDVLAESARHRGLRLVRSRVRTPGKRRFGTVGLVDPSGKQVFGMDEKGPTATPEQVQDYLRNLGAKDWGASLGVAVLPRKRSRTERIPAAPRKRSRAERIPAAPRKSGKVIELRPKAKAPAKPKPPPKAKPAPRPPLPQIRDAKPADAARLVELIRELGHEIDEKSVRKNLAALKRADEMPFVGTLGKQIVGLCGIHRMVAIHREKPVGRVNILIVTEQARGRRFGRMLIEAAEERLKKLGCGRVEITVGDSRAQAQAFYRHMGYDRSSIRYWKLL